MTIHLDDLPYAYDALQPYMSRETLELHHAKHHLAYVNNCNNLLAGTPLEGRPIEEVVRESFGRSQGLFNNAGQHLNHQLFWTGMAPGGATLVPAHLAKLLDDAFGNFDRFKAEFIRHGIEQFGSGWVWLVVRDDRLQIMATANAETPIVYGATPVLACDVWEHAYYVDYRNRRADYIRAFLDNLVNWDSAAERLPAGFATA